MNETDAVSCQLCLCADELGSMLIVEIHVLGNQEPSEKVICRSCAATCGKAYADAEDELHRSEAPDEHEPIT